MPPLTAERSAAHAVASGRPPASASRRAQALALAALVAAGGYLVWRWGFTVEGSALWLAVPLAVAETYGLAMLGLLTFSCWRLAERPTPDPLARRRVAILIATFDEDEDVLRPTVVGALAVRNEPPPEVWVLDDGGRAWVQEMCASIGARYLSRPAPRADAKAGNINHALMQVDAEFLVTLDADHVPRPELIERMLGHMGDPAVAVVQGPQAFYNRGFGHPRALDDPLRNEQSIFFDTICRGKDRHGAAFWCGCPSLIRRAALMDVGGVATETVVEDAHTSLKLNARGWRVVYHHEVMALGLAPEEIGAFVVQRARWARGSLQMLRLEFPLLKRGLTWRQRIEYSASCLHFLEGPQRLVGLLVPPLVLVTAAAPVAASPLLYLAIFIPHFVLVPLASKALTRGQYRVLEGERYSIVRMEAYLRALAALPRGRGAGFSVTPKGARAGRSQILRALRLPVAIAALTLAAIGYQTTAQLLDLPGRLPPAASTVTTLWAFVNIALIISAVAWAHSVQHRRRSHRFPAEVHAAYSAEPGAVPSLVGRTTDLSRYGARIVVMDPRTPGERIRLVLLLDDGPIEITGSVATVTPGPGDRRWVVGVDFDALAGPVVDAIISWCFRFPFGPDCAVMPARAPRPEPAPPERSRPADAPVLAAAEAAAATDDSGDEDRPEKVTSP
jgi:cellulose synthase (UDP-forming)